MHLGSYGLPISRCFLLGTWGRPEREDQSVGSGMPGMTKRRGWEAMASEAREMGVGGVCCQDRGYLSIPRIYSLERRVLSRGLVERNPCVQFPTPQAAYGGRSRGMVVGKSEGVGGFESAPLVDSGLEACVSKRRPNIGG